MLSAFSYPVFVNLFEPASRSECFPDCVQEAREEMSLADGQSGAEEDDSNCIHMSGDILYTMEEELELTDDQPGNQPEPGALAKFVRRKSAWSGTGWLLEEILAIMLKSYQRISMVCV